VISVALREEISEPCELCVFARRNKGSSNSANFA